MAFTEPELNISQVEIDEAKASLVNTGQPNAFVNAIAEREKQVRDWTAAYIVPEETLRRLWRPLVLFTIYSLLEQITKSRQLAYDEAMKELTGIRDGEFPYEPVDPGSGGGTPSTGKWGSEPRIDTSP